MKKAHIFGISLMLVLTVFFIIIFSKTAPREKALQIFDIFDTYCEISVNCKNPDNVLSECTEYLHDVHSRWSVTNKQGEIAILNSSKKSILSPDTVDLLEKAISGSKKTDGYFDATIGNIINLWDFKSSAPKVPDKKDLSLATKKSGYEFLELDKKNCLVTLKNDISINLGGIAKGYATDKLVEILKKHEVKSALVNLGGNVYALGKNKNNKPFSVGIADPKNPDSLICTVLATDTAVVTSGSYQRYFDVGEKRYHHLLNPFDGMSAKSGLLSVTIITPDATDADILSTALFVMGYEKSLPIIEALDIPAIFVTEDNKVYYSSELFEFMENENPGYEFIKIG